MAFPSAPAQLLFAYWRRGMNVKIWRKSIFIPFYFQRITMHFCCRRVSKRKCQSIASFPVTQSRQSRTLVSRFPDSWRPYLRLMRADNPTGTWTLFWPSSWSLALAGGGFPDPYLLALFGAGSLLMRSSACVMNDLIDKDIDKMVVRTKSRPLASGELTEMKALYLLAGLLSASLVLLLQLEWISVFVGASSILLTGLYPLAKRFTHWPQVMLGLTLNWGVLIGWTHVKGFENAAALLCLYAACVCHTIIYDTIYANQDKADDLLAGVGSTALLFGDNIRYWLSGFGAMMIGCLATAGHFCDQSWPYYLAVAATGGQIAWQVSTFKANDGKDCWTKFRTNRWLGAILFGGIVLSDLWKRKNSVGTMGNSDHCDEDEVRDGEEC